MLLCYWFLSGCDIQSLRYGCRPLLGIGQGLTCGDLFLCVWCRVGGLRVFVCVLGTLEVCVCVLCVRVVCQC